MMRYAIPKTLLPVMSSTQRLSYSAAAGQNLPPQSSAPQVQNGNEIESHTLRPRRSPSPSHIPRTDAEEESVFVLTLLTDKAHHSRMTELRKQYFPRRLNKLAAHLTLFHALPGSRLESDIIPTLQDIASKTSTFKVVAEEPFRMKKGFAVSVSARNGGSQGKQIHRALQDTWKQDGFLSDQDAGGCRLHYTLMNKVDDEGEVNKAYSEFSSSWKPDAGIVEGLALWRYDRGFWKWEKKFSFAHAQQGSAHQSHKMT